MYASTRLATVLWITLILLVGTLASPLTSTAFGQDGGDNSQDQYDEGNDKSKDSNECPGAQEVANIGPTTADQRREFQTTGEGFLVSYEVNFTADESRLPDFTVDINGDTFETDRQEESGSYSFFVPEEAGSYEVQTDIYPNREAEYTLTVEDCTGDGEQQNPPGDGSSDQPGGGNSNDGNDDGDIPGNVDRSTIPSKNLPNTGGPPFLSLLLFGGAGLAATVSLASIASRRIRQ